VHDVFYTQTKKVPSKAHPFDGTLHNICMICTFCWADTILLRKWWRTDLWKWKIALVWK